MKNATKSESMCAQHRRYWVLQISAKSHITHGATSCTPCVNIETHRLHWDYEFRNCNLEMQITNARTCRYNNASILNAFCACASYLERIRVRSQENGSQIRSLNLPQNGLRDLWDRMVALRPTSPFTHFKKITSPPMYSNKMAAFPQP